MCRIKEKELMGVVVDLVLQWRRTFCIMIEPALVCKNKHDAVQYHSLIAAQKVRICGMEANWTSNITDM